MSLLEKPTRCEARIHVGLKFTQPVLGVLPRNRKALVGMFSVAFKGKKDYPPERIAQIAEHVLEELGGESQPMMVQGFKKNSNRLSLHRSWLFERLSLANHLGC